MPPKAKFTKEQITKAALGVVSEKGAQALTAKELGAALGTSTTPIFTVFHSRQEVQDAVMLAAMERFEEYAHKAAHIKPVFKQMGMQMILFAKEEPKLYQLIFMSSISEAQTFDDIYAHLGSVADECLDVLQKDYDLSKDNAKTLFEHVWIHTFGIGALCATGMCDFSHEQIAQMLTQDFTAMMMLMKSGKPSQASISG
ncbi:MAG: TetR/AcrR family transcriptional regulator [Oscillospiraceae bacterium]|nr:TetR/AcrR family transcriptional regulator [Oscillospiraceae bacterium]MDY5735169.1 TetR/AcrR family transcriptional regulator [Oscillospiraceae bacterium]